MNSLADNKGYRIKDDSGFTLLELLVVVAIVGILSAIGISSFSNYKERANNARVQGELHSIRTAILALESDTGQTVGGLPLDPCVQGDELVLSSCDAGLKCETGQFDSWQGPYINTSLKDPWGGDYDFDTDYLCSSSVKGCGDNTGWVRAIHSRGRDGNFYTADDVALVLCTP